MFSSVIIILLNLGRRGEPPTDLHSWAPRPSPLFAWQLPSSLDERWMMRRKNWFLLDDNFVSFWKSSEVSLSEWFTVRWESSILANWFLKHFEDVPCWQAVVRDCYHLYSSLELPNIPRHLPDNRHHVIFILLDRSHPILLNVVGDVPRTTRQPPLPTSVSSAPSPTTGHTVEPPQPLLSTRWSPLIPLKHFLKYSFGSFFFL